jgi:hypothetical protein
VVDRLHDDLFNIPHDDLFNIPHDYICDIPHDYICDIPHDYICDIAHDYICHIARYIAHYLSKRDNFIHDDIQHKPNNIWECLVGSIWARCKLLFQQI